MVIQVCMCELFACMHAYAFELLDLVYVRLVLSSSIYLIWLLVLVCGCWEFSIMYSFAIDSSYKLQVGGIWTQFDKFNQQCLG